MPGCKLAVPSGRDFDFADEQLLKSLAKVGFFKYSDTPFTLASKAQSHFYIVGRDDLTHNPHVLSQVGTKILEVANSTIGDTQRRPHFLGLPTAGTALAAAASLADHSNVDYRAGFSIIREVQKTTHGAAEHKGGWVVGKYNPEKWIYFPLDNVATDGGTKFKWAPRLEEDGFPVHDMDWILFTDRQQGAVKRMQNRGLRSLVVYQLLDVTYAFKCWDVWPQEALKAVEREIAENQFT